MHPVCLRYVVFPENTFFVMIMIIIVEALQMSVQMEKWHRPFHSKVFFFLFDSQLLNPVSILTEGVAIKSMRQPLEWFQQKCMQ